VKDGAPRDRHPSTRLSKGARQSAGLAHRSHTVQDTRVLLLPGTRLPWPVSKACQTRASVSVLHHMLG